MWLHCLKTELGENSQNFSSSRASCTSKCGKSFKHQQLTAREWHNLGSHNCDIRPLNYWDSYGRGRTSLDHHSSGFHPTCLL